MLGMTQPRGCYLVSCATYPLPPSLFLAETKRDRIESCLRSILAQEPPPGGIEIVVADGMSNDGTREILKRLGDEYPSLRIIDNPQRIVSSALNEAIRAARGEV